MHTYTLNNTISHSLNPKRQGKIIAIIVTLVGVYWRLLTNFTLGVLTDLVKYIGVSAFELWRYKSNIGLGLLSR